MKPGLITPAFTNQITMFSHWLKTKDGKEYAVRFSNAIGIQLAVEQEIPSNKIQEFLSSFASWPIGRVYRYYYLAFRNGAKKEKVDFDLDMDDFIELIGEDETVMPQVLKIMEASYPDAKKPEKEVKKKVS